ncbi:MULTISPECIES: hypothetical protein [unclassified Pseudomonas]|uniref:hypothetical protein n=1 Tax=unclassified Pseudomonas TaxID=196821 RepID=UPI000C88DD62|nr:MULTISPECIES: hypothetical protein [unclassified Pseudomonas]PMX29268.1 hypothetical protein C1Y23_01595 [Pseudomonas sp. GW460-12]PMX36875.1 hypothetical protein C1Y24_04325 [Pseudomonas sp. MPR-R2A4]PMX43271.1 hypothetical protein C1Y26_03195 [Pseudomonas sp. MPR-R2A7]PMX53328.1 hypothetical protein C1Y17_14290 [Pseudomonas sp. MPR-R2A6]PMX93396.1 hypothetical protein C1Y21_02740 [Pseudomonas sp. MPR-R2A3]
MLIGSIIVVGLFCLIVLGTSQKFGHSGTIGVFFGVIAVPAFVSLIWRSAYAFSWWTIAIFIGLSFFVGLMAKAAAGSGEGAKTMVLTQPITGFIGTACAIGCWFVK